MKKLLLLTKTLLVAVLLCVGASNAWGVDHLTTYTGVVGAIDNTSGFNTKGNKQMSLQAGDEYVITFVNNNKGASGTDYWENWAFCSNVFNCRADHGASNPYWGSATNVAYTGSTYSDIYTTNQQWLQAYNGVTVTITVSRNVAGDGISISHTATTNAVDAIASQIYSGTFTATVGTSEEINFYLTCEDAHLKITNVHANVGGVEKNYALLDVDHTASSSRNKTNDITTTVDAEYEHYNNTKAAAWGGWAYAQFSYTVPVGYSVESATLTWSTTIGGNSGTRNNDIYYVNAGTTIDYASLTSSTNLNPDATFIVQVQKAGPATHTGIATDVSSAVRTIAATQNYIIFKWTNNAAGADLHGKTSANPPTLELATTAETFYTATFNANDGALNPSVTVYTDAGRTSSIAKDALSANTTYYYTATLAGYNDYEGSFAVETSDPVVNFTMTAKTVYNYTVNAVDGEENIIKSGIASGTCYADEEKSFYIPACVLVDGVLYFTADASYSKTETVSSNNQVFPYAYTTSTVNNVKYFFEGESLNVHGTYAGSSTGTKSSESKGDSRRPLANSYLYTPALAGGNYTVYIRVFGNNAKSENLAIYYCDADGENPVSLDVNTESSTAGNYTTVSNANIAIPDGKCLAFYKGAGNSNFTIDYIYLIETVSGTITPAGWSTFASPYALDLSTLTATSGATAYYASNATGNTVTLSTTDATVPAGEGIMVKGTAGETFTINVATSGTAISGNLLKGQTTTGNVAASTAGTYHYVFGFKKPEDVVTEYGFYNLASDTEVAAGKAYLETEEALLARALRIVFDDVTGVEKIEAAAETKVKEGKFIENGKLVIVKNGVKYNAAGQQVK